MVIVPNTSVGQLFLGMQIANVESMMGMPTSTNRFDDWIIYEYDDPEISSTHFEMGVLKEIFVTPTANTLIWNEPLCKRSLKDLERLLLANGHTSVFMPRCHPAIRDRLVSRSAGLCIYIQDSKCDDVVVCKSESIDDTV